MKNSQKIKFNCYHWKGINRQGNRLSGKLTATNADAVKNELRQENILVQHIQKKSNLFLSKKIIRHYDIYLFTRQLATLLSAGIPIFHSLDLLIRDAKYLSLKNLFHSIKCSLEKGVSFSNSLQQHPKYFNTIYCHLIAVGEKSGTLDIILDRIAIWQEKSTQLKNKITKALIYPTAVIGIGAIITALILWFVVPQFVNLFNNFGAALPLPTRIVIHWVQGLKKYGWAIGLFFTLAVTTLFWFKRKSKNFAHHFDRLLLQLPIFGKISQQICITRLARSLSTLIAAGIPINDALSVAAHTTGNHHYTHATFAIRQFIIEGHSLQQAFKQTRKFPSILTQLINVGETTGKLEKIFEKIADIFEKEVDNSIDVFTHLLEPFIMVILGILIGGLVITLYLPIFKLSNLI